MWCNSIFLTKCWRKARKELLCGLSFEYHLFGFKAVFQHFRMAFQHFQCVFQTWPIAKMPFPNFASFGFTICKCFVVLFAKLLLASTVFWGQQLTCEKLMFVKVRAEGCHAAHFCNKQFWFWKMLHFEHLPQNMKQSAELWKAAMSFCCSNQQLLFLCLTLVICQMILTCAIQKFEKSVLTACNCEMRDNSVFHSSSQRVCFVPKKCQNNLNGAVPFVPDACMWLIVLPPSHSCKHRCQVKTALLGWWLRTVRWIEASTPFLALAGCCKIVKALR